MDTSPESPVIHERRTDPRAATRRQAVFRLLSEGALSAHGRITDISPAGLRIETGHAVLQGSRIEIEVHPREINEKKPGRAGVPAAREEGAVQTVTGRVVHVQAIEKRRYALGVQLEGTTSSPVAINSPAAIAEGKEEIIADFYAKGIAENAVSRNHSVWIRALPEKKKSHLLRAGVLLLVLLFLTALALAWWTFVRNRAENRSIQIRSSLSSSLPDGEEAPLPDAVDTAHGPASAYALPEIPAGDLPPGVLAFYGAQRLARHQGDKAAPVFELLLEHPESSALDRFLARMGLAEAAVMEGRKSDALIEAQRAFEEEEGIPESWLNKGEKFRGQLLRGIPDPPFHRNLSPAIHLERAEAAVGKPPLRIEIRLSDYELTVFEGDDAIARYPVGVGRDGATPAGTFHIANKLTDPDWYNRGVVVQAGDPENPLGRRWMGLGDESGPTSYGIHPTEDGDSIGNDCSRGCIRMRPEDAESLFRLCPIGTEVTIVP